MADIESRQRRSGCVRSASITALVVPNTIHKIDDRDLSCCSCSSVERPSTAGDVFVVIVSLTAVFKDRTVYSVLRFRIAIIYFAFSVPNCVVFLLSLYIFILYAPLKYSCTYGAI